MRPTLRQMQYLVAIADTGKFGDAAKIVNVSQPSLSAQIAEMEAALGVVLVERSRQGAMLTRAGEEFVRRARIILKEVGDLKAVAKFGREDLTGRWCCQSNANPSPLFEGQQVLDNEKFAPFAKGGVS